MDRIKEFIDNLCSDGVAFKKLGEIADIGTGSSNGNEAIEDGQYPFFIRSQTIKSKNDYEYDEEAIIIPGEGGIGEIFHYINGKYALHQRVYRIHFTTQEVDAKFAYYYMRAYFKPFIMKKAVNGTVSSIRKPMIEEFQIPLPPMAAQREIVHVLDKFTLLSAELAAELAARREQYGYYRDSLLTFEEPKVSFLMLKDITERISDGMHNLPKEISSSGEFPVLSAQNVNNGYIDLSTTKYVDKDVYERENKRTQVRKGSILLTIVGAIGRSAVVNDDLQALFQRSICVINPNNNIINSTFLKYWLDTKQMQIYMENNAHGAAQKGLYLDSVGQLKIPVPSIEIQEKIVNVLENFDKICSDLKIGLPAEIEKRQQQYEYYRDKLLTFNTESATIFDRQTDRQTARQG